MVGGAVILSFLFESNGNDFVVGGTLRLLSHPALPVQMSTQLRHLEERKQSAVIITVKCVKLEILTLGFSRGLTLSIVYAIELFGNVSDIAFISLKSFHSKAENINYEYNFRFLETNL